MLCSVYHSLGFCKTVFEVLKPGVKCLPSILDMYKCLGNDTTNCKIIVFYVLYMLSFKLYMLALGNIMKHIK